MTPFVWHNFMHKVAYKHSLVQKKLRKGGSDLEFLPRRLGSASNKQGESFRNVLTMEPRYQGRWHLAMLTDIGSTVATFT